MEIASGIRRFFGGDDTDSTANANSTDATASDVLPLPKDGPNSGREWRARLQASESVVDNMMDEWTANHRRYRVKKDKDQHQHELLVPTTTVSMGRASSRLLVSLDGGHVVSAIVRWLRSSKPPP